jgi:hypothetical protein
MDALYIIFLIKPQQLLISLLIDDDVCSMLHLITSSKPYNIFPPNFINFITFERLFPGIFFIDLIGISLLYSHCPLFVARTAGSTLFL